MNSDQRHALHARAECEELRVALGQTDENEVTFHDVARAWFGVHDEHPLPEDVRARYLDLFGKLFEKFAHARGGIESDYFPEHLNVAVALTDIEVAADLPDAVRHTQAAGVRAEGRAKRLWKRVRGDETPEERAWRLRRNRASAAAIHLEPVLGQPDDWASKRLLSACLTLHYKALEFLSSKHRRVCLRRIFIIISWLLGTLDSREGERRRAIGGAPAHNGASAVPAVKLTEHEADYLWHEFRSAEQYYSEHAERRAQLRYTGGMMVGIAVLAVTLPTLFIVGQSPTRDRVLVTLLAGALGAIVSVLMRLTRGSLQLEREAETRTLLLVGAVRPFIGAVFGALVYVLVEGGLLTLTVTTPQGSNELLSYAGLAFLAGFSERIAQTTVATASRALTPDAEEVAAQRPATIVTDGSAGDGRAPALTASPRG